MALWGVAPIFQQLRWADPESDDVLGVSKHGINKEFDVLIAALPHLRHRFPRVRLVLTGTPDESRWSRRSVALAERLGVVESVCFAGDVPNEKIPGLIQQSRLLVYPTWCESFGLPLAEALAMGAPAVAADIPGLPRGRRRRGAVLRARRPGIDGRRHRRAARLARVVERPGRMFFRARKEISVARQRPRGAPDPAQGDGLNVRVSVLVPTLDEELNLPACLDSVAWADEVFVVDSFSHDRTIDIAREHGAHVVQHAFESYSRQKNWALENLPFRNDWVLIVDADERVTPELRCEIESESCLTANSTGTTSIDASSFWAPGFATRAGTRAGTCGCFGIASGRYDDREVHEHVVLNGRAGYLQNDLLHLDQRGLEAFVARHNRYSTLEASARFKAERDAPDRAACR